MSTVKNPPCIYCKSTKVIKHGKTSTGNPRYRCRSCNKTWVLEKNEPIRPDMSDIAEAYLGGRTCRDLVSIYHSSPLRINQKIREFLDGCPNWEDYLDSSVKSHDPKLIYLLGRKFSCSSNGSKNNEMYLAIALDALSSVILGFEIGKEDSRGVWLSLIDRLNCRGIICPSFMANGSRNIEEAVSTVFPYANLRINYHRAFRDKEVLCCLSRLPINNKLINDAVKMYNSLDNRELSRLLKTYNGHKIQDILFTSQEDFISRVNERFVNISRIRAEGFSNSFQTRFEKFHMLKEDPFPIINGWIARFMTSRLDIGFSRLSLYQQIPCSTSFKAFSCGERPKELSIKWDSPQLKTFVIEIAARGLQLPIVFSRCEMKFDKCSLV